MGTRSWRQTRLFLPIFAMLFTGCLTAYAKEAAMKDIKQIPPSCRESPYGPGDWLRKLDYGGLHRRYIVHVPPGYTPARPVPVVLFFHGGGGNAMDVRGWSGYDELSDQEGFIVVYPDGTGPYKHKLHTWNAGGCCGWAKDHNVDDVGFTARVLDEVGQTFCTDRRRVYATGISNGGIMSYRLAVQLSDRIAAIAPVSGTLGMQMNSAPTRPVSVIHFHGTADELEPFAGGKGKKKLPFMPPTDFFRSVDETMSLWAGYIGAPPRPASVTTRGSCTGYTWGPGREGSEVVLWKIDGGGHTWPGAGRITGQWYIGKTTKDISATRLGWEFFKRHPMP